MAGEGMLLAGSGCGFTRQKRFGDSRMHYTYLDKVALEAMLLDGAKHVGPTSAGARMREGLGSVFRRDVEAGGVRAGSWVALCLRWTREGGTRQGETPRERLR